MSNTELYRLVVAHTPIKNDHLRVPNSIKGTRDNLNKRLTSPASPEDEENRLDFDKSLSDFRLRKTLYTMEWPRIIGQLMEYLESVGHTFFVNYVKPGVTVLSVAGTPILLGLRKDGGKKYEHKPLVVLMLSELTPLVGDDESLRIELPTAKVIGVYELPPEARRTTPGELPTDPVFVQLQTVMRRALTKIQAETENSLNQISAMLSDGV